MDDLDFFKAQQKSLGKTIQIFNQHEKINHKNIVLSGFPYDIGNKKSGYRHGSAKGPIIFRQSLINYDIILKNKIKIYDVGNILNNCQSLSNAHQQLMKKHKLILQIEDQNHIQSCIFSIGGSHDQCYANIKSLEQHYKNKKIGLILVDSQLNCKVQQNSQQINDENFLYRIIKQIKNIKIIILGVKQQYLKDNQEKIRFLQKNNVQIITYSNTFFNLQTKLLDFAKEVDEIMVSFDISSLNVKWMPGVSKVNVGEGFNNQEVFKMMEIFGIFSSSKLKILQLSNFNPAMESLFSSIILIEMFYHFCQAYGNC